MKAAAPFQPFLETLSALILFFSFSLAAQPALAQEGDYPDPSEKFSREELTQMLAPIALYPDALLTQVLMASTYPIEVIEADRWRKSNPGLEGEALDQALLAQDWDPSVKALCHFSTVLSLMSERISETTTIGNAFLAQEEEVMSTIQELRSKAYAEGNLATNSRQQVIIEKETIIIEPPDPRVVYVPYYDPYTIYGPWWYPAYPPYYWGPRGVNIRGGISYWPGFSFGFVFGNWSYVDWRRHAVHIHVQNRPRYVRHDKWFDRPGHWRHIPHHRRGVAYRDKHTARKYGQHHQRSRVFRPETRGFPDWRDRDRGRDHDRDRYREERSGIDREKREEGRSGIQRELRYRQLQEQSDRERLRRQHEMQERLMREQAEHEKRGRIRVDRDRWERARLDQERQVRERLEGEQRAREHRERGRSFQRVRPPEQPRDNVFNRVDDGRGERRSSERGRTSRQGRSGYSGGKGPWDGDDISNRFKRRGGDRGGDVRERFGR